MIFIAREEPFTCEHCGASVTPLLHGTYRNHCPNCLWSRHLDERTPGDRASECCSLMEPIGITVRGSGEWVVVHRCSGCEEVNLNRSAGDDNPLALLRLAVLPLAQPPFPLEWIGQL